jgi:hypothetical protein
MKGKEKDLYFMTYVHGTYRICNSNNISENEKKQNLVYYFLIV